VSIAGASGPVFLGYARCKVESNCASIRSTRGSINDWVAGMTGEELAGLVSEMKTFSMFLEEECERYGLRYFDGSADFDAAVQDAEAYLLEVA
jgi:hypothetical protein